MACQGALLHVCYRLDLPVGMDIMVSEEGPGAQWLENRSSRVGRSACPLTCVGGISVSEVSTAQRAALPLPLGDLGGLLCSALLEPLTKQQRGEALIFPKPQGEARLCMGAGRWNLKTSSCDLKTDSGAFPLIIPPLCLFSLELLLGVLGVILWDEFALACPWMRVLPF